MTDQDACEAVWALLARRPDLASRLPAGADPREVARRLAAIAGENGIRAEASELEQAMAQAAMDDPHALSDAALDAVSAGVSPTAIWAENHKILRRLSPEAQREWLQTHYGT